MTPRVAIVGGRDIAVGSRWREKRTGRIAVILQEEVHGTGPAWTYEDEPNGWHYSFLDDFVMWNAWEPVSAADSNPQPGRGRP